MTWFEQEEIKKLRRKVQDLEAVKRFMDAQRQRDQEAEERMEETLP